MKRNSSVSIIMINFNGLKYLKESVPPLLKLNYQHYELIIADNGSADGSLEYIKAHRQIKLVSSPRYREKNYACNYAISRAGGDYILLLDNDVVITDPDILSRLLQMYTSLPEIGALGLAVHDRGINEFQPLRVLFRVLFYTRNKEDTC